MILGFLLGYGASSLAGAEKPTSLEIGILASLFAIIPDIIMLSNGKHPPCDRNGDLFFLHSTLDRIEDNCGCAKN
jgi:hypothetical protein